MERPARKDTVNKRAKKLWSKHRHRNFRMLPRTGKQQHFAVLQ